MRYYYEIPDLMEIFPATLKMNMPFHIRGGKRVSKHYFIGIKIPSTLEDHVEGFKNKYQLQTAYKVIPHIEDLHVTLLYIGPLSEQHLPSLTDRLSDIAAGHTLFSLHINGLSYFGPSSGPRVVYLAVSESVELSPLQREIEYFCRQTT